jgi:hypothetical protein
LPASLPCYPLTLRITLKHGVNFLRLLTQGFVQTLLGRNLVDVGRRTSPSVGTGE